MEYFNTSNIVKKFSNHLALNKVSINVPENSIYGLLGPNGAGKTTLIRIINQITAPDSGNVFFKGKNLQHDDIFKIGYLPEERGLYKKMKVGEQVLYLAQLKGLNKKNALIKIKNWFEKFEIQAWWGKKVEELSKGMQQKIQFIVTILHEPELLIFDEPFSGFDPINTKLIKDEILKLRDNGSTIIFSTHNMSSVEELCDHIGLLNNSEKILEGNINQLRKEYRSDTYNISFTGNFEMLKTALSSDFYILDQIKDGENTKVNIKLNANTSPRELISRLNPVINIISFNELIPNMNDIFIRVVESTNISADKKIDQK